MAIDLNADVGTILKNLFSKDDKQDLVSGEVNSKDLYKNLILILNQFLTNL